MLQQKGDIWKARQARDWVCVTTNGILKKDGSLVMGKGIALQAAQRYPFLPFTLGTRLRRNGIRVEVVDNIDTSRIIAFPTKYDWHRKSDINLILKSTIQLLDAASRIEGRILLPRPGCGSGGLEWSEVEPLLQKYLASERFIVFYE